VEKAIPVYARVSQPGACGGPRWPQGLFGGEVTSRPLLMALFILDADYCKRAWGHGYSVSLKGGHESQRVEDHWSARLLELSSCLDKTNRTALNRMGRKE